MSFLQTKFKMRKPKQIRVPTAFEDLFLPCRHKVYYGGRGGAKSWAFSRALAMKGLQSKIRVLCAREYQTSITDSVHKLLGEQIFALGLSGYYDIQRTRIIGANGTEFIFKGLRHNVQEIKSTEGVDICWVEEAQSVSEESWSVLIPTIRNKDSEIWLTFNPIAEDDPTYQRFVVNPPPNSIVRKVSFRDNPYFPDVLKTEMEYLKRVDLDAYNHVWEGNTKSISEATILRGKVEVRAFETPPDIDKFYFGADWGFSQDPTTLVRAFIVDRTLFVDYEAYGVGVDIDKTGDMFDKVPESRKWDIYADSARPETISYLKRQGFKIKGASKWGGSVEDGIAYLRQFEKIVVHERCKHTAEECRLYRYKTDQRTGEVLPVIVDANNHIIDALRYSLSMLIKSSRPATQVLNFSGGQIA